MAGLAMQPTDREKARVACRRVAPYLGGGVAVVWVAIPAWRALPDGARPGPPISSGPCGQLAGAATRNTFRNSRIQAGWSGHARPDTIAPSMCASLSTHVAPAAATSGAQAG
jgi:hypothetical protein